MSEAIQSATTEGGSTPLRPRAAGSVVAATPAQGQLLDAHQQQLRALGAELRQAREARGLSLAALADRLRLGQEQLRALEQGDTLRLPELVFVIAQLRRVAGALDLDLGDKLAQLRGRASAPASNAARATPPHSAAPLAPSSLAPAALATPSASRQPSSTPAPANQPRPAGFSHPKAPSEAGSADQSEADARSQRRGLPRWRLAPLVGLPLLAVALAFGLGQRRPPTPHGASTAQKPAPFAQAPGRTAGSGGPSPVASRPAASPSRSDSGGDAVVPAQGLSHPNPANSKLDSSHALHTDAANAEGAAVSDAASATSAAGGAARLNLQASEASWLEVRDGRGELLFRGSFQGSKSFPLTAGLRLLPGRPDLISVASEGKPARPLGPISAVDWYSFSAAPATGNQITTPAAQPGIPAAAAPVPARP